MKKILPFIFSIFAIHTFAQPTEMNMLGNWSDSSIPPTVFFDNPYNEVWGLATNEYEIGIIGTTLGAHFINVTDPSNPVEIENAFVAGAATGTGIVHRDYHDYNGYLYAVCDEGPSTLQIIDLSYLPDSTVVVYDSDDILRRAHNVFIDSVNAKLYACGVRKNNNVAVHVQVIDIADPLNPVLLNDYNGIPYLHDIYVENNIAYANCGTDGFFVVDFTDATAPVVLGSMTTYPQQGYNHSGWLDTGGDHYYLADETWDKDLKVVDVSNFNDMSVLNTFNAEQTLTTIPHNLIVRCDRLYVSYYYEGLQVYDIADPANPVRIHFYDTSTRPNTQGYEGAWGVYPFLPSGNILVSDMQNGLYVLEGISDHDCEGPVSTSAPTEFINQVKIYPQPAFNEINIELQSTDNQTNTNFELIDITGKTIQNFKTQDLFLGKNQLTFELNNAIQSGFYFLKISNTNWNLTKKIIIGK